MTLSTVANVFSIINNLSPVMSNEGKELAATLGLWIFFCEGVKKQRELASIFCNSSADDEADKDRGTKVV